MDNEKYNYCYNRIIYVTGATGPIGPTGPQGNKGKKGATGPAGVQGIQGKTGPAGATGPAGTADTIIIRNTITGEPEEEAKVTDAGVGSNHILDFIIPKGETGAAGPQGEKGEQGEKGDVGPQGPEGPQGPTGTMGPTSYSAIAFASFGDTQTSGTAKIYNTRVIPGIGNRWVSISDDNNITIKSTNICEITLCGRISGVTKDTGANFCLYDATKNEVVSDMIFELNKGDTPDMDFSETNVVDIIGETNLQLRTAIDDNNDAAGIKFTYMNVIIKVFNI